MGTDTDGQNFVDLINEGLALQLAELETLNKAAKAGEIGAVDDFWAEHGTCNHVLHNKNHLVRDMLDQPEQYVAKERLLDSIKRDGFDFVSFFYAHKDSAEDSIFRLYGKDANPDTAKVAGILAAEYLRFRLQNDPKYTVNINAMFSRAKQADAGLSGESAFVRTRDSIVAVQNALVDYVREKGPSLPLNQGAAMLLFIEDDVRAAGNTTTADLWTKKISGFRERRIEGLSQGAITKYAPVFAP